MKANPVTTESQSTEARITIMEYRQDQGDKALHSLRTEYTEEHKALRQSLQGIEKNLQTIKWVSLGAGIAFLSQTIGIEKAFHLLKVIF